MTARHDHIREETMTPRTFLLTAVVASVMTACNSPSPTEPAASPLTAAGVPVKVQPNHLGSQPSAIFAQDCKGRRCTFDSTKNQDGSVGSHDTDGTIVSREWRITRESSVAGSPPVLVAEGNGLTFEHRFEAGGCYTVTLTVTDNDGQTDSRSRSVCVNGPPLR